MNFSSSQIGYGLLPLQGHRLVGAGEAEEEEVGGGGTLRFSPALERALKAWRTLKTQFTCTGEGEGPVALQGPLSFEQPQAELHRHRGPVQM